MIEKQKLITWMELNGYDFYKGYYDSWLKEFYSAVDSGDLDYTETCKWEFDSEDGDVIYQTECGNVHQFTEGNIKDNDHVYCAYCGKPIEEVKDA